MATKPNIAWLPMPASLGFIESNSVCELCMKMFKNGEL